MAKDKPGDANRFSWFCCSKTATEPEDLGVVYSALTVTSPTTFETPSKNKMCGRSKQDFQMGFTEYRPLVSQTDLPRSRPPWTEDVRDKSLYSTLRVREVENKGKLRERSCSFQTTSGWGLRREKSGTFKREMREFGSTSFRWNYDSDSDSDDELMLQGDCDIIYCSPYYGPLDIRSALREPGSGQTLPRETDPLIISEYSSPAEAQSSILHEQLENRENIKTPSCLSQSCPSQSQEPPATITNFPRAPSLPNMKLQSSFEEFTPGFTGDEDDETYWFQCSSPGRYQCRLSSLVFDMKGEGDVFYRIVPWSRTLLSQHDKKPAGPLFDISCQQQSVVQLHLPHCEIRSTGGCHFLSVAHVHDGGIEFIRPEKITETHVIINITGFSAFGNVKDEDSAPDPVRALVLLFYKSPADPESDHLINVLMLPKNVVLTNVLHFRKKLDEDERFLETPPHCKLQPKQLYTLSTCPGEDSVLVQPTEAEFDAESYDNYLPTFQVVYEEMMKHIKLFLKDSSSSSVWERRVCLSAAGVQKSCGPTRQNLGPMEQLEEIRISFMDGISEPVLQSLLDRLLRKKVLSDPERETVEGEKARRDKARVLLDSVRRKGDAASSEMIHFLCELDPFLSEHLGLM